MKLSGLVHTLPLLLTLALLLPVSGYRHLWQDEIETAERARSILATGLPQVVDPQGRVSVNAGGREIEEGTLHRYTPWGQFYVASLGLKLGEELGLSPDASLRAPFIFSHGLTSSFLSYGLTVVVGMPALASVGLSSLFALQSVRILHNRTARYHALIDVFFVIGMLGLGLRLRGRRWGAVLLGGAIFILPHTHTLGGSLAASILGFAAILAALLPERPGVGWSFAQRSFAGAIRSNLKTVLLPALISLALLLLLTRPWLQGAWSQGGTTEFRSIKSGFEIAYSFYIYALAFLFLFFRKAWALAVSLVVILAYTFIAGRLLDLHPFSQSRYYLALPIFFLFWPLALYWPVGFRPKQIVIASILTLGILLPEFQGVIRPWQGLRVIAADWRLKATGETQPLQEALAYLKDARPGAVLIDYVPQFANWYLPERDIALMPDLATRHRLNIDNPIWRKPLLEPVWHVTYLRALRGQWNCTPSCDYVVEDVPSGSARYRLSSARLGKSFEMCIVKRWKVDRWNNAPFAGYDPEAYEASGKQRDELVVSTRCP